MIYMNRVRATMWKSLAAGSPVVYVLGNIIFLEWEAAVIRNLWHPWQPRACPKLPWGKLLWYHHDTSVHLGGIHDRSIKDINISLLSWSSCWNSQSAPISIGRLICSKHLISNGYLAIPAIIQITLGLIGWTSDDQDRQGFWWGCSEVTWLSCWSKKVFGLLGRALEEKMTKIWSDIGMSPHLYLFCGTKSSELWVLFHGWLLHSQRAI